MEYCPVCLQNSFINFPISCHSGSRLFCQSYILEYTHQFSISGHTAAAKIIINTLSGDKAAIRCHRDPVTKDLEYRRYLPCEIIMDDSINATSLSATGSTSFSSILVVLVTLVRVIFSIYSLSKTFFVALIREQYPYSSFFIRSTLSVPTYLFSHINHQSLLLSSVG